MAKMKKPGFYIEEISKFPPVVAEAASAVPAFIGYTEKTTASVTDDLLFVAKKISSLLDFENIYGGLSGTNSFVLFLSLQLYFANGGSSCYIVSIGGYAAIPQQADFIRGLDIISKEEEPTLLVFPDAVNLPGNELYVVQKTALAQAAFLTDRFCILDIKYANTQATHTTVVNEFRHNIGTDNLKYGAAYTPHLQIAVSSTLILPPSGAIAGQYCSVDRNRGVWKAPANVSLSAVTNLAHTINDSEQQELNIDTNAGKSINAIRRFTGKGFLIWGARTLAGNDNEWRYVSVRRFFNMVEESVKKASLVFVFEPNDANTWIRLKAMLENYLMLKWRDGALAGSKPEQAFYVKIGLGQTMTALDILEGRLIVEIGMAAMRPAEFIVFQFSQKMESG